MLSRDLSLCKSQPRHPQTRFLKLPPLAGLDLTCKPSATPPVTSGVPVQAGPRQELQEKELWAGLAGASPRGGLGRGEAQGPWAAGFLLLGRICALSPPGLSRSTEPCLVEGEARPERGSSLTSCLSHKAAEPSWACSPGSAAGHRGVGEGPGPPQLVNFEWHQASESGALRARACGGHLS